MRFEAQHPQAVAGFRTLHGFRKADTQLGCCYCGSETSWFHAAELLFFCSDECYWRYVAVTKREDARLATP